MPWPVPDLPSSEPPQRLDWRIWLLVFLTVSVLGAAAVVFFWPRGWSAQEPMFWATVAGVPLCAFALLFGIRLNDWEQRQLDHEERLIENTRITSLWREWANRDVMVVGAACFAGGVQDMSDWAQPDCVLPINLDRACALDWLEQLAPSERYEAAANVIVDRLSGHLARFRRLHVLVLLDEHSVNHAAQWESAVRKALAGAAIRLSITCSAEADALSYLPSRIDQADAPPSLIIAGQFHADGVDGDYSEGVAGILMCSRQAALRSSESKEVQVCRLLRPMVSEPGDIAADLSRFVDFQLERRTIRRAWLGALDHEVAAALPPDMSRHPPLATAAVNDMNDVLGKQGPVSAWLTLAIAADVALRSRQPQLAIVGGGAEGHAMSCTLLPETIEDRRT